VRSVSLRKLSSKVHDPARPRTWRAHLTGFFPREGRIDRPSEARTEH
jgi:hypothetical protein